MSIDVGKRGIRSVLSASILIACAALLAGGVTSAASARDTARKPSPKTCKVVVKKVQGKKKRVSVCSKQRQKPVTPASAARTAALRLAQAKTPAARYQALVAAMRTLDLRVYTSAGKVLVPGTRDLPRDFHLYDVELRILAGAYERGQGTTLTELGQQLAQIGVTADDSPLGPETIAAGLASTVRSAVARPSARSSLVPLLVRELGLRRGVDLARGVPPTARLDPLQTLLVLADVSVGVAKRFPVLRAVSAVDGGPCSGQGANAAGGASSFGQLLLGLIKQVGPVIKIVTASAWPFHGVLLAYSVHVEARSPELQQTHYGPGGHHAGAGQELRFKVLVRMRDDVGEILLSCGPLAGLKFPGQGPIPGVAMLWEQAESSLQAHGTVAYDPADGKTGPDGTATLVFTPKDEKVPSFGLERDARGVVNGTALYQSAFGNIPGSLAQFLVPKYAGMAWQVTFHKPRGFKFAGLKWRLPLTNGVSTFEVVHARHCGDDPFGGPFLNGGWAVILHEVSSDPAVGGGYHYDGLRSGYWTPGETIVGVNSPVAARIAPGSAINLNLDASPMQVNVVGSSPGWQTLVATATVEEDLDNGAFPYSCAEVGY